MSITAQCPSCNKKLKAKDELAGKRIKCPGCGQVLSVPAVPSPIEPTAAEPAPLLAPQPKASTAEHHSSASDTGSPPIAAAPGLSSLGDDAATPENQGSAAEPILAGRIQSESVVKLFAIGFAIVAAIFAVTFLAGILLAFLNPVIKALQGESNRSVFQVARLAIFGIVFIGSFLVFILAPLLVTTAACTNARFELANDSSTKRVAVVLALALSSTALLWVCLPWVQYAPNRAASWSEETLTIYRLVYCGINMAIGVILAVRAPSPGMRTAGSSKRYCPKCRAKLRTAKAKQCFSCGANWHDQPA